MLKVYLLVLAAVFALCGCTSFAVSLELPDVESADVVLSAEAVKSLQRTEDCEVIRLVKGVWRVTLKNGRTNFTLPFEPGEVGVSVTLEGIERLFRIVATETEQGETVYESKPMNAAAADWTVEISRPGKSRLQIIVATRK
jgi:hypothetical protein